MAGRHGRAVTPGQNTISLRTCHMLDNAPRWAYLATLSDAMAMRVASPRTTGAARSGTLALMPSTTSPTCFMYL